MDFLKVVLSFRHTQTSRFSKCVSTMVTSRIFN